MRSKADCDNMRQDRRDDWREHHSGRCKGREIEPRPPDDVGKRGTRGLRNASTTLSDRMTTLVKAAAGRSR
jgi:hypothetical protein